MALYRLSPGVASSFPSWMLKMKANMPDVLDQAYHYDPSNFWALAFATARDHGMTMEFLFLVTILCCERHGALDFHGFPIPIRTF